MLLHLNIRNVAIIEESSFSLDDGLHVFTGETGAGKSILINSLGLALGGRASTDLVRTGTDEATVSAIFSIKDTNPLVPQIREAGIPFEEELLLRRIISANGRSRAYINERPVTVAFLRTIGRHLCEISGQHEHQHLLHPKFHLNLLDAYGELIEEREGVTTQYEAVRTLRKELEELGGDAQNRARRRGYLQYQIDELEEAELDVEEEELEQKRRYMLQIEQMIEAAQTGEERLYSGSRSVLEALGMMQNKMSDFRALSDDIDAALKGIEEAEALLDDAARTLRHFTEDAFFDGDALEDLQTRLTQLRDLKRKHGVQDIEGLIRSLQEYQEELADLDRREARMEMLEANYHNEVETLRELAKALSRKRRAVSKRLAKDVEGELASLGMKKATFLVEMTDAPEEALPEAEQPESTLEEDTDEPSTRSEEAIPGPTGYDQAQFLLSSNPGEEPKAMHRIASGGELSRIMLALKQVAAERDPVPTCIFDEVDAGIGGMAAATIGQKIHEISHSRQVLCITHLPQIACHARHHYHIEKNEEEGRTHSTIQALSPTKREREIARMLGGMEFNEQSRAHARELLSLSHSADETKAKSKKSKKPKAANGIPKKTTKSKTKETKAEKKAIKTTTSVKESKQKGRTSKVVNGDQTKDTHKKTKTKSTKKSNKKSKARASTNTTSKSKRATTSATK